MFAFKFMVNYLEQKNKIKYDFDLLLDIYKCVNTITIITII